MTRRTERLTSPGKTLEAAVHQALDIVRKAKRNRKSLTSDNFYANKVAELRADATNAFRDLSAQSTGDVTAMAELMQDVFSPKTGQTARVAAARELVFALRTTWYTPQPSANAREGEALFPMGILAQAKRGYLMTIGRQMNGCFAVGWYDACAVMMRRLMEVVIIEAFENKGRANQIKGQNGNYLQLTDLVGLALAEPSWSLSRNTRKCLPQLRDVGHMSAHGRYYHAQRDDIEKVRQGCRVAVEEFLHHAGLL